MTRAARAIGLAAGLIVLIAQLAVWYPRYALQTAAEADGLDFPIYQRAAARVGSHRSPYEPCLNRHDQPPFCLLYPPPFTALLVVGAHVSFASFAAGIYAVLLIAFWAYAAGLVRLARGRVTFAEVGLAALALLVTPGLNLTMAFGNLDLVVWALVVWGLVAERWLPLLVIAAACKLWPAVPLAVLVAARPRRWPRVALTAAAVLAFTIAVVGTRSFAEWRQTALPVLEAGTVVWSNISAVAILERHGVRLPRLVVAVLPAAAAVVTGIATRRRPEALRAAWCAVAALFCASICWWHYAAVLWLPAAAWLQARRVEASAEARP